MRALWTFHAVLLSGLAAAASPPCFAGSDCIDEIAAAATKYGIPAPLLYAVAVTESGRPLDGNLRPNPYAVNVHGTGYHFASAAAAIAEVARARELGIASIDVGCLQVNLKHHPQAFPTMAAAFDPATNVDYGAHFLRDLYGQYGNWTSAVAYYHSGQPTAQWDYVCQIHERLVQYGLAPAGACSSLRAELGRRAFRPGLSS